MTREPDPSGFDAIVAAWRAEGNVPEWPDDLHLDEARTEARTDLHPDGRPDASVEDGEPAPGTPDAPPSDASRADGSDTGRPPGPGLPEPGLDHGRPDPGGAPRRGADPPVEGAAARRTDGERSRPAKPEAADPHADEHFVPPEPPPLPRMGPPILIGITLIALGLVLVTFPGWVGVPQVYGLPLGLVAIAAGLGWLVLRLWPDPEDVPPPLYLDDPDDPDGGAVL